MIDHASKFTTSKNWHHICGKHKSFHLHIKENRNIFYGNARVCHEHSRLVLTLLWVFDMFLDKRYICSSYGVSLYFPNFTIHINS